MELKKVNKKFCKNGNDIILLKDVSIKFNLGKFYMIIGPSGAGKTTLINILGLLDTIDSGEYKIDDVKIDNLNDLELAKIRLNKIGMIFQDYYLNSRLTAKENIKIACLINHNIPSSKRDELIDENLKFFGLSNRANHYPDELSGGEEQRVAIARAIINNPDYILADEPTGSLDSVNAKKVINILQDLKRNNKCIIMVTHNYEYVKVADFIYKLENGKLKEADKNAIYKEYSKEK